MQFLKNKLFFYEKTLYFINYLVINLTMKLRSDLNKRELFKNCSNIQCLHR